MRAPRPAPPGPDSTPLHASATIPYDVQERGRLHCTASACPRSQHPVVSSRRARAGCVDRRGSPPGPGTGSGGGGPGRADAPRLAAALRQVAGEGCYLYSRDPVDAAGAVAYTRFFNPTARIQKTRRRAPRPTRWSPGSSPRARSPRTPRPSSSKATHWGGPAGSRSRCPGSGFGQRLRARGRRRHAAYIAGSCGRQLLIIRSAAGRSLRRSRRLALVPRCTGP